MAFPGVDCVNGRKRRDLYFGQDPIRSIAFASTWLPDWGPDGIDDHDLEAPLVVAGSV